MRRYAAALALVASAAAADTLWKNQGVSLGPVNVANCSGNGLTCSRVGSQVNITVAGDGGSLAPVQATYITQTPNTTLTNEQALSLLASGLMFSTTATGAVSIFAGYSCGAGTFASGINTNGTLVCATPAGTVTSVTATPPLFSSGGAAPNITCAEASAISGGCWPLVNADLMVDAGVTVIYNTNGIAHIVVDNASNGTSASTRLTLRGGTTDAGVSIQSGFTQYSTYFSDTIPAFVAILHTFTNEPRGMASTLSSLIADEPGAAFHWYEREGAATYQEIMKLERAGALRALIADAGVVRGRITGTKDCAGTGDVGCITTDGSNMIATLPWTIASGGTNGTATPTVGGIAYGTGTAYAFTSFGGGGEYLKSNGESAPTWETFPSQTPVVSTWSVYCDKDPCPEAGSTPAASEYFLMPMVGKASVATPQVNVSCNHRTAGTSGDLWIGIWDETSGEFGKVRVGACNRADGVGASGSFAAAAAFDLGHRYYVYIHEDTTCETKPGNMGCTVAIPQ